MVYSVLKSGDSSENTESFMGIATSDLSFVIMKIANGVDKIISIFEGIHSNDITTVLSLTDNLFSLSFVTLSLDSMVKVFSHSGELVYESAAQGQVITGVAVPYKKEYFLISTFNEETQMSGVCVYRK